MLFKLKQSKQSFEKCLQPHLSYLYRVALRLSGNPEDAEDLVHDLVLKVHNSKTDLLSLENPKAWLAKVLYRLFVDGYRQKQRVSLIQVDFTETGIENDGRFNLIDESSNPEQLIEQYNLKQSIEKALLEINDEQRLLIIMYEIEGFSLPEISEIIDVPIGTIKSRLHRARMKLRQLLDTDGTDSVTEPCLSIANKKITSRN